jgi:putative PIN family toxin of toxin-antitoxin system
MVAQDEVRLPRVVLDTNCVVSALLFSRGRLTWLRQAWQRKRFIPLASRDTVTELIRVLGYPKFKLSHDDRNMLLADFLPYAETIIIHRQPANLPKLRDPDDLIFLALARRAKADALVSGDRDILSARKHFGTVPILSAVEFSKWLDDRS